MSRVKGEDASLSPNSSSLRTLRSPKTKCFILNKNKTPSKSANASMDSSQLSMDSEEVQNFIATTGCPIFTPQRGGCETVAVLLLMPDEIDPDKVCCQVPPSCPGIGNWLFVVSLDHIDPDDISCDSMGSYERPHSRKYYFKTTEEGEGLKKIPYRHNPQPDEFDYYVRANRYNHRDKEKGKLFTKFCYLAYNNRDEMLGPYGAVQYCAQVDPSTLERLPRGNAKSNKPMVRTRPSAIKQAKALLLTHTPRQVMETMETAQSMLGQTDPSHLPRGVQSISSMTARVPGYVKKTKAGRPRKRKMNPSNVSLAHDEDGEDEGEGNEEHVEVEEEGEEYTPPAPLLAPRSYARLQTTRSTTPSKFDALKIQVLHSERKRNDAELQKIELEKDYLLNKRENLLSERDKLESESEFFKAGTDKLHLEMSVLKAKKIKLDMELAKMRNDEDVVVVRNDMGYRASYQ